jgi:hemoglobin
MKAVTLLLLVVMAGCAHKEKTTPAPAAEAKAAPKKSLYERLGQKPAITAVVDDFLGRVAADKRINLRFMNTDLPRLRGMLIDFVCHATGGPEKYRGSDMSSAHAGLQLVDEEFNALVENLGAAMKKLGVPEAEQNEVVGALGPLKPQIVDPPSAEAQKHDPQMVETAKQLAGMLRNSQKTQAADLLDAAITARVRGQRNYADQLYSAAELQLQPDALAALSPLFREGAPPRVATKLKTLPKDTPAQPKGAVGSSDDDDKEKPKRGSLSGTMKIDGQEMGGRPGVIMLTPASGKYSKRPPRQRVVEQREREFAPHVMAVPVGSTVSFPNFDPVFHNVFSLSPTKAFDLGIYKNGETREVTFEKEGFVRLGCNLHANMAAYLVVVGAPHYVVTDEAGKFRFKSLQPGKYKVRAWTEMSTEPVTQNIEIKEGENTLELDAKASAAVRDFGTDKFGVKRSK